jgi:hypothetical protein
MTYARLIDEQRFDELSEIMCEDVHVTGPGFDVTSFQAFRNGLNLLHRYRSTFHFVGNHYGEWRGQVFLGETYCIASHIYEADGTTRKFDMGIRYCDRIVRDGGKLKFRERVLNVAWTQDSAVSLAT